ncbi:amino acid ABC transporter permease [Desulfuromonas versatilis]|uniref:Amino acid ABC transporter permease n=1 Tax=Desulfuromonas versatilis TaxID=2802975 RepID=A0ABN6E396_9BACT|nr:amino acid ABC transporter permease [Desulfuromonas versatilis]BCR06792.1 amino acid ABC transporter permease [Desulfuromonas versatilis]
MEFPPTDRRRPSLFDLVLLLLLASLLWLAVRAGSDFSYRWDWGAIPQFLFRYDPQQERWVANLLVEGLLTTVRLSLWSTLLATLFGTLIGLSRVSPSLFKRLVGQSYVGMARNLPPLVLIFIFYYFVSGQLMPLLGVDSLVHSLSPAAEAWLGFFFAPPALLPEFLSALVTLAIFEGAYIAEIVRAGIQSLERGQWEGAAALGLSRRQQLRHVILPQALPRILPALAGQFISTIKDSAIVSVISIQELTFQGMELMASTYLTLEIWITVTLLYFALTFACSLAVRRFELRMQRRWSGSL